MSTHEAAYRQSFAWWSFRAADQNRSDAELLRAAATEAGMQGVEMLPDSLHPVARDLGLALVSVAGHELEHGFNDRTRHDVLRAEVAASIEAAAAGGVANVIVFAGTRAGLDDTTAAVVTAEGLAPLAPMAADAGVTLVLELLNSKVDHPGHQCDHTAFAADVVRRVDHPGLRILFDCYHMQIMEGDLVRSLESNLALIGHVHTGGNPGRRQLDHRQETNWTAIAGTLVHRGYDGWVGHEFLPRGDAIAALRQAHDLFTPSPPR